MAAALGSPAVAQDAPAPAPTAPATTQPAPAAPAEAPATPAAPSPDTVIATVGDETITEADLSFAAEDLGEDLQNIAPADRRAFLVTVLIDMKVMAQAARNEQMDQTEIFKQRLRYLEDRALRRAYFADRVSTVVTPEAIQAAYDTFVASFQPAEEIRARHILVTDEADARAIKAELDGGADFATIATEKSIDPSGASNGGDLGFFGRGSMVKPFEDAAFALTEVGQVSEPVQSQFGWHIIKLEEKRQSQPPTLEQLTPQLQQQVLFEGFNKTVDDLKSGLAIEIADPALAAQVNAQAAPEGAAADPATAPVDPAAAPAEPAAAPATP